MNWQSGWTAVNYEDPQIIQVNMSNFEKIVDRILASFDPSKEEAEASCSLYGRQLLNELKMSHKEIAQRECRDIEKSKTKDLIGKILDKSNVGCYELLKDMLQLLYLKQSPMLAIVYQFIPTLLRLLIEIKERKNPGLQKLVSVIQANQIGNYNRSLKEKQQIRNNPFIRDLYMIHFNSKLGREAEGVHLQLQKLLDREEGKKAEADRQLTKTVLLYLIYKTIGYLKGDALKQYLKTIYIYCGGDLKDYSKLSSFYLLQKKHMFNAFRYSISEEQIEWMLLSLYELSIQSQKDKYELLAAINMIYKKTANESMFKYSEVAQSIIHILEDEYQDIFS